ncbi:MAG: hypothetical protein IT580_02905 [Verrucomicrobiales bacterium]|jgi:hypothetical protein|nr:hypothetical protein [Verrucomicrobiales bacterium]
MKHPISILTLAATLLLTPVLALAHGRVDLGPNGGRLVPLSTNATLQGEVVLKEGRFHVTLLDPQLKPVELKDASLTVVGGERNQPERPRVERVENRFVFPALKGNRYLLVLQFRSHAAAKPVNARFEFDASPCGGCQKPEWLCQCTAEK